MCSSLYDVCIIRCLMLFFIPGELSGDWMLMMLGLLPCRILPDSLVASVEATPKQPWFS